MRSRPRISIASSFSKRYAEQLDLNLFGGALADHQIVDAADVADYRLVELVSGDANRLRDDDSAERNHRNVGRAAADVYDHVPRRSIDRQPGADRSGHRLFDDIDGLRARELGSVTDRALFDARDLGGDANRHGRLGIEQHREKRAIARNLLDEVVQHRFGHFKVGDHAVAQRPNRMNVARRLTEHLPRLFTDRKRLVRANVLRNDRRLAQHDPFSLDVHEYVCSP